MTLSFGSILTKQHAINYQILLQSAICRALPRNSRVIIQNQTHSILNRLVDTAGFSTDIVFSADLLFKFGGQLIQTLEQANIPMICVGSNAAKYTLTPQVQAGFSGLAATPQNIAQQSLDDAFYGVKNLRWVALEVASIAVLNNAKQCIDAYRPLFSFGYKGQSADLLKWCDANGYFPTDETLTPLVNTEELTAVYLFPDLALLNCVKDLLTCRAVNLNAQELYRHPQFVSQVWPQLCSNQDSLGEITQDYLVSRVRTYEIANLLGFNLYLAENDGDTLWRWTGPGHDTSLLIPIKTKGLYRVSLTVMALPEGISHSVVRCFMNGTVAYQQNVSEGTVIGFDYYVANPYEPLELLISTEQKQCCAGRELGIAISSINVSWGNKID